MEKIEKMEKMEMETCLDDNVVIPDYIKKMTIEELEKAIAEFEDKMGFKRSGRPTQADIIVPKM